MSVCWYMQIYNNTLCHRLIPTAHIVFYSSCEFIDEISQFKHLTMSPSLQNKTIIKWQEIPKIRCSLWVLLSTNDYFSNYTNSFRTEFEFYKSPIILSIATIIAMDFEVVFRICLGQNLKYSVHNWHWCICLGQHLE